MLGTAPFTQLCFFCQIVQQDDHLPMQVESVNEVNTVLDVVWVSDAERNAIQQYAGLSFSFPCPLNVCAV